MERGKDKKGKTGGETFPGSEGAPGSQSDYVYGGQEYYYQPHLSHLQYSYDMMDASQWAAHTHGIQQHHHLGYPPLYGYHYPLQHMEGVPLPPGIPGLGGSTDPLEAALGRFPCTRLRNFPYDVTLEDILVLFQGLVVIDVVLSNGGDAFVLFANPMDFQMALQRNRHTIGRRFVEICAAARSEYYEAVAMLHEEERGMKFYEEDRGTKFSSESVYENFFRHRGSIDDRPSGDTASTVAALWGQRVPSPPLHGLTSHSGFSDPMGLAIPLGGDGSRGSSVSGRDSGRSVLHAPPQKRAGGGIQVGDHTGFLRMRGLPFSAAKEDIYRFFIAFNPIQDSIVLTFRNDGRATGEAYIGFATPEDAERAMALHRQGMGSRYIELFISNKEEQGRALARFANR